MAKRNNFKTAAELGITDAERKGLAKVLKMMESGTVKYQDDRAEQEVGNGFNMGITSYDHENYSCGTVCCIGGWVSILSQGVKPSADGIYRFTKEQADEADSYVFGVPNYKELRDLYFPEKIEHELGSAGYGAITIHQAAYALRGYLETGKVDWEKAIEVA